LRKKKDQTRYVLVAAATSPATAGAATATSPNAPGTSTATAGSAPASATGPATASAGTRTERVVKVGADDGTYCEILSGLSEGDKVIIETGGGDWAKLKLSND
jgi:hypothetical protein